MKKFKLLSRPKSIYQEEADLVYERNAIENRLIATQQQKRRQYKLNTALVAIENAERFFTNDERSDYYRAQYTQIQRALYKDAAQYNRQKLVSIRDKGDITTPSMMIINVIGFEFYEIILEDINSEKYNGLGGEHRLKCTGRTRGMKNPFVKETNDSANAS